MQILFNKENNIPKEIIFRNKKINMTAFCNPIFYKLLSDKLMDESFLSTQKINFKKIYNTYWPKEKVEDLINSQIQQTFSQEREKFKRETDNNIVYFQETIEGNYIRIEFIHPLELIKEEENTFIYFFLLCDIKDFFYETKTKTREK